MDGITGNIWDNAKGLASGTLSRFIPQPQSSVGLSFSKVVQGVEQLLGTAKSAVSTVDIDPEYRELIEQQMEMQEQMMRVSLVSNVEKAKHETNMAAVRNLRVT